MNDVGNHAPVLEAEPFARAAPARKNLVGHQQQLPGVAELPQLREEVVRRHDRAAPALDRFEHEARDRADRPLVEVLAVKLDVRIGVDRAIGFRPRRTIGIRPRHHVRSGGPHRAVDVGADVAERDGAIGLAVEIVEADDLDRDGIGTGLRSEE